MSRVHIDCRDYPNEMHCTVAIVADSEQELIEAAAQHAVAVHQHEDGPALREALRQLIHMGDAPSMPHAPTDSFLYGESMPAH